METTGTRGSQKWAGTRACPFPIWVLLTKAFQTIFGGLNPADAAALGCGITTAAAIGLLALLAHRLTGSVAASLFGAWCVAVGHEVWNHATIAEVYPLNLLVLASVLLLFDRWREEPSRKRLFWVTFVYGCGMANHPTFLLFLPLFAIAVIVRQPRIVLDWRAVGLGLAGLLTPHLAYLQTWIAAANNPFVSWGVEPNLRSIFGHYMREVYAVGPPKTDPSATKALGQLEAQGAFILENLTLPGIALAAFGLLTLARRDHLMGGLLLALAILGTVGLLPFVPFDVEREELFASRVFLMPAYLVLGVGLSVALIRLAALIPASRRSTLVRLALLTPAVFAAAQYGAHDRSSYFWSEDYGRAILDDLPKNTVLLPSGDTSTFPLLYLQACLHVRPDVVILDRSGAIEREEALALLPESARAQLRHAPREALLDAIMTRSGRPVVAPRPERYSVGSGLTYEPLGLGFLAVPAKDNAVKETVAKAREAFFAKLQLRNETLPTVVDHTAEAIRSHVAQCRALNEFRRGNPPAGLDQAALAAAYAKGIKESWNNIGSLVAENGFPDRAEPYFREALAIRADYQLARQNLIVVLRTQEKRQDALVEATFGAKLDPAHPFFFQEATDLAVALGDPDTLRELCASRIRAVPDDTAPHRILGEWALDHERAPIVAKGHFEAALAIDPGDKTSARRLREANSRIEGGDVAAATNGDRPDAVRAFSGLLPPGIEGPGPEASRPMRARRFGANGDGRFVAVPGARDVTAILKLGAADPAAEPGLPHHQRATSPTTDGLPREESGVSTERDP